MIDEFEQSRLRRRRAFLESRAKSHLAQDNDRRWHIAAAATLLRDAAAVALMLSDVNDARPLLRESGKLFIGIGLIGGLQLLYVAGALDSDDVGARDSIDSFDLAFRRRFEGGITQPIGSEAMSEFDDDSFRPSQLLRAYQGLAGRRANDEQWFGLRREMRKILTINATMPVGPSRLALSAYLMAFDQLAKRDPQTSKESRQRMKRTLSSFAQRREELLTAARSDRFHWGALLRPAELVDFDLLALLLAGIRRGKASRLIAAAFAGRDAMTELPRALAVQLSGGAAR